MKKVISKEFVGYKVGNVYRNGEWWSIRRDKVYEEVERWVDDDGMREYGLKDIEDCIRESFEDMGRYDVEINIYNLI